MGAHCAFKKLHVCLEYTEILAHKAVAPEGGELPRFTPASPSGPELSPAAHARHPRPVRTRVATRRTPAGAVNRTSSRAAGGAEC